MFHPTHIGEEFAVKKRALDVAIRGCSDVKLPKGKKTLGSKAIRAKKNGLQLIQKTLEEQQQILDDLDDKIQEDVAIALKQMKEEGDTPAACLTMKSIKRSQHELVRVLRVVEGIKVIEEGLQKSLIDSKTVAKTINEVLSVLWKSRSHKKELVTTETKLLQQLQNEDFFPYLSPDKSGKVRFRKRSLRNSSPVEEELTLAAAKLQMSVAKSERSVADSMPPLSDILSDSVATETVAGGDWDSHYAPSEVSSAPNSPKQEPIHTPIRFNKETLVPDIILDDSYPSTGGIVLDALRPTFTWDPTKNKMTRWASESNRSLSVSDTSDKALEAPMRIPDRSFEADFVTPEESSVNGGRIRRGSSTDLTPRMPQRS